VPAGESAEGASLVALTPMLVQPDGRFDFAGVPPGQYVLRVQHSSNPAAGGVSGAALAFLGTRGGGAPVPQAGAGAFAPMGNPAAPPPLWAAESITVGAAGVSGLSIQLRRATKISGRVEFVGAAPQPAAQALTRASVQAQPMSVEPSRPAVIGFGRLSPDATFLLDGVVPGRYVLSAFMPGWPTIKSVVVGGVDVTDIPIEIDTADVSDVVVTLGDTPMPTVLGTVTGGQRGSAEDVSVLFFPADRRYWADPAGAPRRFRSMPVARNGSFLTAALAPGEYFAIVVTDQQAIDWQQASRLDALSRTAQRVTLAEGDKKTLELKR
jgi:hypothetical protein